MGFCFFFSYNFLQGGRTALHFSADYKYEGKDKMSLLLENGADVNAQDYVSFNLNEKGETDISVFVVESMSITAEEQI